MIFGLVVTFGDFNFTGSAHSVAKPVQRIRLQSHMGANFIIENCTVLMYIRCVSKKRTPATFCNNSNSPGSVAIDFDKNNR